MALRQQQCLIQDTFVAPVQIGFELNLRTYAREAVS